MAKDEPRGGVEIGWTRLKCNACGVSQQFVKKVHLISRAGGGTTEEIAGFMCRQCNGDVDMAAMLRQLDVERKRAELKALQEEVGEPTGGPAKRG